MRERWSRTCHPMLMLLWLASAGPALCQSNAFQCGDSSGFYRTSLAVRSDAQRVGAELPTFVLRKLPPRGAGSVDELRTQLRACAWHNVRALLFGDAENPAYVDWIVYVDSLGGVRQAVVSRGSTSHVLQEQRYIWVLVFSDRDLRTISFPQRGELPDGDRVSSSVTDASPTAARGGQHGGATAEATADADVRVTRRVIMYRPDPLLTSFVRGVGKAVSITPPTETLLNDSTQSLAFEDLSTDPHEASLHLAQGRFGLVPNAQVELSVTPAAGKTFISSSTSEPTPPAIRSIYTDVADVKRSWAEMSIAAALTVGPSEKTYDAAGAVKSTSPGTQLNAYVAGMLNLPISVALPWQHPSWRRSYIGVGAGTNIARGSFGDELLVLGALSRVLGDAGLVAGADWLVEQSFRNKRIVNGRTPRFVAGVDVRL